MFAQYKEAIENSNIVSKTDIDGIITFVNDEFCNISGYARSELIGVDHNIVRHPDVPAENFKLLWDTILNQETFRATVKNRAKDGSSFYVNSTIIPILDNNHEIEEFIAIRYDVTQEVELQLALEVKEKELQQLNQTLEARVKEQTRKLHELNQNLERRISKEIQKNEEKQRMLFSQSRFASLGQMMANIAHQWRQPLTELSLSLYSLKSGLNTKSTEEIDACYNDAKRTIQSMSSTIEDFQNFFKPDKDTAPFDPIKSLDDALALMKKALNKERIHLSTSLQRGIFITGISNELTQVFINLLQNAKDALKESDQKKREITISVSSYDNRAIIIIHDNGTGINEGILEKVFEPYFSTKHASQGTGLGLFMSRMIIQQSLRGTIEAQNSDRGACFTIKIPLKHTTQEEL